MCRLCGEFDKPEWHCKNCGARCYRMDSPHNSNMHCSRCGNIYAIRLPIRYEDRMNTKCDTKYCRGTFKETGIQDDMHGELHCDKCGKMIKRHEPIKD